MACSMRAFAAKHATAGSDALGDEQFVTSLVPAVARLVAYHHERGEDLHVVRYEELIAEPDDALAGICEYLSLDVSRRQLAAIVSHATEVTPQLIAHRTSADAAASVGRATAEMAPELLESAEEAFGPALDAFGYERSRAASGTETVTGIAAA
jgi:hypothetical protein